MFLDDSIDNPPGHSVRNRTFGGYCKSRGWSRLWASTSMSKKYSAPAFLTELLHARSPSGHESEAQAVFDRHVKPAADTYSNDSIGNRIATLNPDGDPVLMLAGHL